MHLRTVLHTQSGESTRHSTLHRQHAVTQHTCSGTCRQEHTSASISLSHTHTHTHTHPYTHSMKDHSLHAANAGTQQQAVTLPPREHFARPERTHTLCGQGTAWAVLARAQDEKNAHRSERASSDASLCFTFD
jgi:hypothetical protein